MSTRTFIITLPPGSTGPPSVAIRRQPQVVTAAGLKTLSVKSVSPVVKSVSPALKPIKTETEPVVRMQAVAKVATSHPGLKRLQPAAVPVQAHTIVQRAWENDDPQEVDTGYTTGPPPRKRERLNHLSPEEKMNRRKMKNRMAAQTARDRKKMKMTDMEMTVQSLDEENEELSNENSKLKAQLDAMHAENVQLKKKLQLFQNSKAVGGVVDVDVKREPAFESAAFINAPLQKEQAGKRDSQPTHSTKLALVLYWTLLSILRTRTSKQSSENCSPTQTTSSTKCRNKLNWLDLSTNSPLASCAMEQRQEHTLSRQQLGVMLEQVYKSRLDTAVTAVC